MSESIRDEAWEQRLSEVLGKPPQPDFSAWQAAHPEAVTSLTQSPPVTTPFWRTMMKPMNLITATLVLAGSAFLFFWPGGMEKAAFASTIPGIDDPKTMTWTTTFYVRATSTDKERTWIQPERRLHAYRHPGQYRETFLDIDGKPYAVQITDARAGRTLNLDLKEKKATLKFPTQNYDPRGPFAWVGEAIRDRMVAKVLPVKSVSMQGKKEFEKKPANLIRAMIDEGNAEGILRRDFYFDEKSKTLLGMWMPNQSDFDLDTASDRKNEVEKTFSVMVPLGSMVHEIDLNPKIDARDFSLDAPAGFKLEKGVKPTVTEAEMIAYLGAAAKFNGGVFPDSPFAAFDTAKFNIASQAPEEDQTPAEKEMIAQHGKFLMREIYRSPVQQFVDDHTTAGSFHYVGAGAQVDDPKQMVCWFTQKGSTRPRAVFADLKVKEVSPSELPFDLKK